jgi:hypothetical protein
MSMDPPKACPQIAEFINKVKQSTAEESSVCTWEGGVINEDVFDAILSIDLECGGRAITEKCDVPPEYHISTEQRLAECVQKSKLTDAESVDSQEARTVAVELGGGKIKMGCLENRKWTGHQSESRLESPACKSQIFAKKALQLREELYGKESVPPAFHELKLYQGNFLQLLGILIRGVAMIMDFEKYSIAGDFVGPLGNASCLPYFVYMTTGIVKSGLLLILGDLPKDRMWAGHATAQTHLKAYVQEGVTNEHPAACKSQIVFALAVFAYLITSGTTVVIAHNRGTEMGCLLYLCTTICLHGTKDEAAAACKFMRNVQFACTMKMARETLGKRLSCSLGVLVQILPLKSEPPTKAALEQAPTAVDMTADPFDKKKFSAHHPYWDTLATLALVWFFPFLVAWAAVFEWKTMDPKNLPGSCCESRSVGVRLAEYDEIINSADASTDEVLKASTEKRRLVIKVVGAIDCHYNTVQKPRAHNHSPAQPLNHNHSLPPHSYTKNY